MKMLMIYISLLLISCTVSHAKSLDVVPDIDLERYLGTWHQVAFKPNKFQTNCVSDTVANYKLLPNDKKGRLSIQVVNTCLQADGSFNRGEARARINPKEDSHAKLEVTFTKIFKKYRWFAAGDYWIIDIGKDYEYSVVGDPKRDFVWVLSREQSLSKEKLYRIKDILVAQGYNPCNVMMSLNELHQFEENTSLCDYVK